MLPKKEEIRDKVVLVGLNSPVLREDSATEESMDELSALVETAGGENAGIVLQNRPTPDPRTFIGEGKVAEVQLYVENVGATMVIFDNDLSPSQQRVLTELLGVQVLDRCGLILDIFAQRAKTKEGRLQVELAQYRYLLPRLIGMWSVRAAPAARDPSALRAPARRSWKRTAVLSTRRSTRSGQIWKRYVVSGPPSDSSGRRTRSRWWPSLAIPMRANLPC